MSLPYFPMFPTDFEADTSHLTLAEDGAYNRLLRLMWMTPGCSLPDDDAWILRRMRCVNDEDCEVVMAIIDEFFTRRGGRIVNSRLNGWVSDARKKEKRPWIPLAVQRYVFERDGHLCKYCGCKEGPFHLDHITPWSAGGEHTAENLTVACARCNWSKGAMTIAEWRGF